MKIGLQQGQEQGIGAHRFLFMFDGGFGIRVPVTTTVVRVVVPVWCLFENVDVTTIVVRTVEKRERVADEDRLGGASELVMVCDGSKTGREDFEDSDDEGS